MARIAGIAFWSVDGKRLAVRGNLTVSPTATEKAGIAGQDYVHGYSENPVVPYIEGDVSTIPGTAVADVDSITNSTITAELADGRVFTLQNAWRAGRSEVNTKDGMFKVRFEGTACIELVA